MKLVLSLFFIVSPLTASPHFNCWCQGAFESFIGEYAQETETAKIQIEGSFLDFHSLLLRVGLTQKSSGSTGVVQFWIIRHHDGKLYEPRFIEVYRFDLGFGNPEKFTGTWETEKKRFILRNENPKIKETLLLSAPNKEHPYPQFIYEKQK